VPACARYAVNPRQQKRSTSAGLQIVVHALMPASRHKYAGGLRRDLSSFFNNSISFSCNGGWANAARRGGTPRVLPMPHQNAGTERGTPCPAKKTPPTRESQPSRFSESEGRCSKTVGVGGNSRAQSSKNRSPMVLVFLRRSCSSSRCVL